MSAKPLMAYSDSDDEDTVRADDAEMMSSKGKLFKRRKTNNRCVILVAVVGSVVAFVVGILIGRYALYKEEKQKDGVFLPGVSKYLLKDGDPAMADKLINSISADHIRQNLRMLTDQQHLGGTPDNHYVARKVREHFQKSGLDHTALTPYEVMLSYPDPDEPNYVELLDANNKTQYKSELHEKVLTPEENKTNVVPPFNAYSAPGDIYGTLVYVNFGRVEDYEYLFSNKSINVTGKIAFARYGEIYRGDKVKFAERFGAKAIVLFSDPAAVTDGHDFTNVYPHNWYLPQYGAQRGTLLIGEGDPTTPDYPSIETAYRENDTVDYYIPKIPCHPISYGVATHLMENLGGDEVPETWRGGMKVTYRFGDSFNKTGWKAHINVSTRNQNATIYNAIGVIRGAIEPDRYVLLGNHLDAWVFGAIDPSSGTAVMMELARVMGGMVKAGQWRPRRSIIFCGWGAEEYGIIGSTEWVEEYTKSLGARGVSYVNVDYAVGGNFSFHAEGTPLLIQATISATKKVPNPNQTEVAAGRMTVYDTWMHASPDKKHSRPKIALPGSGSDYAPFRDKLGLPIIDMWYTYIEHLIAYPMYHSVYDTFLLVDQIQDRGFHYHRAMGQIWVEMARDLAESLILPFNVSDYAVVLNDMREQFLERFGANLTKEGIDTGLLNSSIQNFTDEVHRFEDRMKTINKDDPFVIRAINDQLMQLDRAFLDPAALPGRKLKRHVLFADSTIDNYSGASFPGLSDALVEISLGTDVEKNWKIVKKHYSVILYMIQGATGTLRETSDFLMEM